MNISNKKSEKKKKKKKIKILHSDVKGSLYLKN